MDVKAFDAQVKTIVEGGPSQSRVKQLCDLGRANLKEDAHLVSQLFRVHKKATPAQKISTLFAIDALSRQCRSDVKKREANGEAPQTRHSAQSFLSKMEVCIERIIDESLANGLPEHKDKVAKVVGIWVNSGTFKADTAAKLASKVGGSAQSTQDSTPSTSQSSLTDRKGSLVETAAASSSAAPPSEGISDNLLAILTGGKSQAAKAAASSTPTPPPPPPVIEQLVGSAQPAATPPPPPVSTDVTGAEFSSASLGLLLQSIAAKAGNSPLPQSQPAAAEPYPSQHAPPPRDRGYGPPPPSWSRPPYGRDYDDRSRSPPDRRPSYDYYDDDRRRGYGPPRRPSYEDYEYERRGPPPPGRWRERSRSPPPRRDRWHPDEDRRGFPRYGAPPPNMYGDRAGRKHFEDREPAAPPRAAPQSPPPPRVPLPERPPQPELPSLPERPPIPERPAEPEQPVPHPSSWPEAKPMQEESPSQQQQNWGSPARDAGPSAPPPPKLDKPRQPKLSVGPPPPLQQIKSLDGDVDTSSGFSLDGPDYLSSGPNMPPDFSSFNATDAESWSKYARTWAKMNNGQVPDNQTLLQNIMGAMQMMQAMQQSMMGGGMPGAGQSMQGPGSMGMMTGGTASSGGGSVSTGNAFGMQQGGGSEVAEMDSPPKPAVAAAASSGGPVKRGGKMQKVDGRFVYVPPE